MYGSYKVKVVSVCSPGKYLLKLMVGIGTYLGEINCLKGELAQPFPSVNVCLRGASNSTSTKFTTNTILRR